MSPTPVRYWVNIQTKGLMPRGLKNGIHIVEAIEDKSDVRIRAAGGKRFRSIPKWRWDQFAKRLWTPGSSPAMLQSNPKGTSQCVKPSSCLSGSKTS